MEYKADLKKILFFEIKSLIRRYLKNNKPNLNSDINYLNLGCGNNYKDNLGVGKLAQIMARV